MSEQNQTQSQRPSLGLGTIIGAVVVIVLVIMGLNTMYKSMMDKIAAEVELRIIKTLVDAQLVDIVDNERFLSSKETFVDPISLLTSIPNITGIADNLNKIDLAERNKVLGTISIAIGFIMAAGIVFTKARAMVEGPPPSNDINLAIKFDPQEVKNLPLPGSGSE